MIDADSRPDAAPGMAAASSGIGLVSCDLEGLYGRGAFPGLADERAVLRQAGDAGQPICELFPAFRYTRPLAADAATAGPDFVARLGAQFAAIACSEEGTACRLYRLADATLCDNVVYMVRSGRPEVLFETYRLSDRPMIELRAPEGILASPPFEHDGPCLFLGSSGSFNYGHWLVDDLPRAAAVAVLRRRYPFETITIVATGYEPVIDEARRQSLQVALAEDRNVRLVCLQRRESIRFRHLYYASPVSFHPIIKSPQALGALRTLIRRRTRGRRREAALERALERLRAGRLPRRRRIFIDRAPGRRRWLRNGEAVFAALEPLGFERVVLDFDGFANQALLFSEAGIVVGNMGASMTNTIFCRPGTPLLYLAPEGWMEPFFWDLAAVLGHDYRALYGPSEGEPFEDPFRVDPAAAARIAARLIGRRRW